MENSKKIAFVGRPGVGKSTTIENLFHPNEVVAHIVEGTNAMIEESSLPEMSIVTYAPIYTIDGSAEVEYEKLYNAILVDCDVVVYIINATSRNIDEDCRILKDIIIPICKANSKCENIFIAFNKIDSVGEMENPDDPELLWNVIDSVPTDRLRALIRNKCMELAEKLVDERILSLEDSVLPHIEYYSAVFEYNLSYLKNAITKEFPDWMFGYGAVLSRIGKYSSTH